MCVTTELISSPTSPPVGCWSSVCHHRAIYCQPAPTQCDVGPVCITTELYIVNLPQPSGMLVQCVSPQSYILSTCLNPVRCWSSVCHHRAIYCQPAPTQCDVGPVCITTELYIVNLPQPSAMLVQCVSPQSYILSTYPNPV